MLLRLAVVAAVACAALAVHEDAKPDCLQAGDGYYVKGCSAKFWRCVNDRLYSYDCPRGLYFNPLKRKCEYKADVAICSDGVQLDTRHVIKASAEFNCTSLPDGPYKPRDIACSNTFITCFNGMAVEQACPFGQFFHEASKVCDYKDRVPGCLQTKGSKIGGSIGASCPLLRSGHVDIPCAGDEICQKIDAPVDGRYVCSAPFSVWYGPVGSDSSQWTLAPEGLRCGSDGRWYNGNDIVTTAAVDCTAKRSALSSPPAPPQNDNARAAALSACPGLLTGKDSEGIPCDADEMCQEIQRPKNGRYSCAAPFSVWYGPAKGSSAQWKEAKDGLKCGSDGFWYDGTLKVDSNAVDCTAKRAVLKMADDETHGCPSLSTNERDIPCKGDEELCQPILKAVAGKYACPTPYRVWYGRGVDQSTWKQAKDALICNEGSWFDGDERIDASAVDCTVKKIDCSKLGDGTYNGEPGRCSTHFWQCSNEQAYLYPCAPGLFFDDFSKTCDYKEVVESCGGTRRSPAEVTTTVAPPAADAAKSSCSALLTDASLPCKAGDSCKAPADPVNQKYICDTPYTLFFGPKTNADQWRQAPNGIQCKDGQWFNGDEKIAPEAVHCTTPKFNCAGKKDGSYSAHPEKCTAYFWNCAHDDSFLYTCPHGLFFDVDTLSCDYKEVITACGGLKKDGDKKEVSIPSKDAPSSSSSSFDCSGKENGYHEAGKCEKKFWNCADGKSFQTDCPEGLVYDGRVQQCQYPIACASDLPATTTPATPPSTLDHGDISKKIVGPTTAFDCKEKPDGLYAEKKCHKTYVECSNGRTFAKECPSGLVYVALTKSCDYKQVCMNPPATAAPSTTPAADPVTTTYSSYATYERIPATTKAPVAPVAPASDKPNCANLENGAHELTRCGQEFFMCWSGETTLSKCNDGLVFNAHTAQCDYRSNVVECGPAADATTAKPGEPAPPSPPVASPAPDLFCEGREDGHFGSGCQSYFYSCQSGSTLKMFCPVGTFYDTDSKTCDLRELIVACGGKKEGTSTTAAAPAAPSSYHQASPVAAPKKDIPANKFCTGKEDGFYAAPGCQNFFYSCQNGQTYNMGCPTDLFYDGIKKACDRREDIVACGATPATTQAPTTPAAAPPAPSAYSYVPTVAPVRDVPIEKFCIGKTDGFYPAPGCQSFFYSCQDEKAHKMDCPLDLFYSGEKKACDRREEIVACGATPTQPPTTPAADASPYQRVPAVAPLKDAPFVNTFCVGKANGQYAEGCSSFFIQCNNGVTYKMACSAGLFFDADRKQCDHKDLVPACGASPSATPAPTTTPAFAPSSPYQRHQPVVTVKDIPTVNPTNLCVGKEDGFYAAPGCESFFFSCQNGEAHKMPCPSSLYYDGLQKKCDHKEDVVACGASPSVTQAPPTPAADTSAYNRVPSVAPVKDVPREDFCIGKEDGFYAAQGCEQFFYSCQIGETFKMSCPSQLYYDDHHKKCDRREDIVACGATPTNAPSVPAADPVSSYHSVPTVVPIVKDVPVDRFCVGKQDGFYSASGCQTFFYSCMNGATYKMDCPSSLYFDGLQKKCDHRHDIVACGAAPPTTQAPSTTPAAAPSSYHRVQPVAPMKDVTIDSDKLCASKQDGFYAAPGCQTFFYSCLNGKEYKMPCPTPLYYDGIHQKCDRREDIVACGATPSTIIPAADPVSSYHRVQIPVKDTPVAPIENFCIGKEDAFYGSGCQSFFYSCQNQVTYKMACPSELYYSEEHKRCDRKEDVAACGATPTQTPTKTADVPTVVVENFCKGKADGFYAQGCMSFFYSCQSEATYKMTCPANLFYDTKLKMCNNREEIPECGALPSTTQTPAAAPARTTAAPVPYPTRAADLAITANFCTGKADNVYGAGCQNFFYTCQSGVSYKTTCSSGLFFDIDTKQCNYRDYIVACGGKKEEEIPATTSAPTTIRDLPSTPETFCLAKEDGFYGDGCNTFFYSCQGGATYKMVCPSSLYYDLEKKACNRKEEIRLCNGAPSLAPSSSYSSVPRAPSRDQPIPLITPENYCAGKPDGFYGDGCASHYFTCQNGLTYKMDCPSSLVYNSPSKMCDRRENVVACGASPVTPVAPAAAPIAPSAYSHQKATPAPIRDIPVPVPVPVVTFSCTGKPDGIYSNGCESYYFSCTNGFTYKMDCPAGLYHDTVSRMCDVKEKVPACGGVRPAPPVAPSRDPAPPVANFCAGKADGIYSNGCDSFYHSCTNGYAYKMSCPNALVFDISSKLCEVRENVAACGGVKPAPPVVPAAVPAAPVAPSAYAQPQQPKATAAPIRDIPVESFCAGKADGIYSNGCEAHYYSCANGYTFKMSCPSLLAYDVSTRMCQVRENVAACGGRPSTPAAAPSQPIAPSPYVQPLQPIATPAPSRDVHVVNFCAGKPDGVYSNGCETYFQACTNGVTYKMACPQGLYHDVSTKMCDVKERVAACGGTRAASPAAPSRPITPSVYTLPTTPVSPLRDVESFCAGKADGVYSTGCESAYHSCSNGYTFKMECPSSLVFDVSSKMCEVREKVAACGGSTPSSPAASPSRPSISAAYAQPKAMIAPARTPTLNFCDGKADGTYSDGCDSFYHACANGFTYKMACASGLVYDVSSKMCDLRENVAGCGGSKPSSPAAAPSQPIAPSSYALPKASVAPARDPVASFCSGKADGVYSNGCESFFHTCSNGITYKTECPSNLAYDISHKMCDVRENIVACGGARPVTPAAAPSQPVSPSSYSLPTAPVSPLRDAPIKSFCAGKVDGIYANGCESFYLSCANGYTFKMACASSLFYDVDSKKCDVRENVPACGGIRRSTPAASPSSYAQPKAMIAPARTPTENFCSGKADGVYASGCESVYHSCANGFTYKMACPSNLVFDVASRMCDVRENVEACGGTRPSSPAAAPSQPIAPSSYALPKASVAPVRDPVATFCSGKADGVYSKGCESFFHTCSNGITYKTECPSNLAYDVSHKMCDVRENIAACGGVRGVIPAAPAAPSPYVQPMQPMATPAPVRDVVPVVPQEKFCAGKTDGVYSDGCQSFYYSCTNGYTYKMLCPSGLFYSIPSKMCEVRENVPACGGQKTVTPVAPLLRDQPAPPTDPFCTGKTDGYYGNGCATAFYSCSAGTTYKMSCPSELVFDVTKQACNRREETVGCGAAASSPAAPAAPVTHQYSSPAAPSIAAAPAAPITTSDNFCAGKADGIYTSGCTTFYYSCANGYTNKMMCAAGLFFEVSSKMCDHRDNVPACGGQRPQQQPQNQYQPAPLAPVRSPVSPMTNNICTGKTEGSHQSEGCQPFFFYCNNGMAQRMDCAIGLFFDVSTKQCEYREKIAACGGSSSLAAAPAAPAYSRPAATSAPAAAPAAPVDYSRPVVPSRDKAVMKEVHDKSCTGQPNGFYGEECNSFFYSCLNGAAYKMSCPTGLYYDLDLQTCEYKDNVPNCGGRRLEVTATPSPSIANLPPAPVDNSKCNGKQDGIYPAADCSQEYISCQAGLVRIENCQTGLFYNEANNMCDYRERVAKCSARDVLPTRAPSAEYGRTTSRPITRPTQNKYDSHKAEYQKKPALSPVSDFPYFSIKIRRRIPRQSMLSTSDSTGDLSPIPSIPFNSSTPHPLSPLPPHHHHHRNGTASRALALILVAAPICQALSAISFTTFSKPLCTLEQIFASRKRRHFHRTTASANFPRVGARSRGRRALR